LLVRMTGRREEHKPAIGYAADEADSAKDDKSF
jgi:hypothetical protein